MKLGSPVFAAYNRTLRRVLWADFIDGQLDDARNAQFKAEQVSTEPSSDSQNQLDGLNMMRRQQVTR